jgi:hypothetical protein
MHLVFFVLSDQFSGVSLVWHKFGRIFTAENRFVEIAQATESLCAAHECLVINIGFFIVTIIENLTVIEYT